MARPRLISTDRARQVFDSEWQRLGRRPTSLEFSKAMQLSRRTAFRVLARFHNDPPMQKCPTCGGGGYIR